MRSKWTGGGGICLYTKGPAEVCSSVFFTSFFEEIKITQIPRYTIYSEKLLQAQSIKQMERNVCFTPQYTVYDFLCRAASVCWWDITELYTEYLV